jgi:HD-GYP domain-containing protein (c-di-GMP phosphodiesterase class II)
VTKAAANSFIAMARIQRIDLLVLAVLLGGGAAGYWTTTLGTPFPGWWTIAAFTIAAYLLEQTGNPLRIEARGSTSFIVHMGATLLYGPLWGSVVAAISTILAQVAIGQPLVKVVFNAAQRVLSVSLGAFSYLTLGGHLPPAYLVGGAGLGSPDSRLDLALFFVLATVYFVVNALAVNLAVALSSGRKFQEVWSVNVRGVLGYDLGASTLSVVLAWLYLKSEQVLHFGPLGFFLVLAPILVIRHIYGLYRKLQSSGRELLDLMVKAIEARDPYTSGHSIRVATLAKAIAQEAKMSADEVEEVYTAAILHDVGKIHEEFAPLLRKETKLTPEETALLQTHPVKSAELVAIISSFRGAILSAVRSHHERWDGGGYPDGLIGEAIPLGARIIMISDTTDAMTTDRPYRKRLPVEAVIAELQKYRGTQFDPKLVDLVINSVTIRRAIAEMQTMPAPGKESASAGGSKRVQQHAIGLLRGRPNWPRIKAF